jgi:hypothetical protein
MYHPAQYPAIIFTHNIGARTMTHTLIIAINTQTGFTISLLLFYISTTGRAEADHGPTLHFPDCFSAHRHCQCGYSMRDWSNITLAL